MAPSDLLNVAGAAAYLNVSTATVYSLTAQGKLAHYRSGQGRGTLKFSKEDLDAFTAATRVPSAAEKKAAPITYQPAGLRHVTPKSSRSKKARG